MKTLEFTRRLDALERRVKILEDKKTPSKKRVTKKKINK